MKKVHLLFIILISLASTGFAQRFDFSIRNALPQFSNPAYVGTAESGRINYGLMVQDFGISDNSITNFIGYDQYFLDLHGGLGVALYDQQFANNSIKRSAAELNYAYQFHLGEKLTLSTGLGLAYRNDRVDFGQIYPYTNDSIETFHYMDYSLGIVAYTKHFYAGLRYGQYQHHFFFPHPYKYTTRNYNAHVGYEFSHFKNKNLSFNTSIHYFYQEGFQSLGLQAFFSTRRFSIGAQWKSRDQMILFGGIKFWHMEVKFAHAIQLSQLAPASALNTSSAVTLQYTFQNKHERQSLPLNMSLF